MDSKSILILSHKSPYPNVDGGSIAISQIIEALLKIGHRVTLLYMETEKHPSSKERFPKEISHQSVFMDTRIRLSGIIRNLFSRKSYILSRFYHKNFDETLKTTLKKEPFDVVIFESLFTSSYHETVKKQSRAKLIYRSHNIEYQIWENQNKYNSNPFVKLYLHLQVKRLKKQEINFWKSIKNIASISITDNQKISTLTDANVNAVHLHADNEDLNLADHCSKVDFFHLGAMDWKPNVQAIKWLVDEVWPSLKNHKTEIHLAGRKMPKELLERAEPGLFIQGEVDDASKFTSQHKVLLVPLFIGSGMRVKIIQAMAQGKCIICTKLAAQGIPCTHGKDILIAETKKEFVDAMNYCIQHPEKVDEIGKNARVFASDIFSQERVINQLNSLL